MMKINILFPLAYATLLLAGCQSAPKVNEWVATCAEKTWQIMPLSQVSEDSCDMEVNIDPTKTLQTIEGFGSCFNEQGWTSLNALSQDDREAVLAELYEPGKGASFTMGRMPIGANDFSLGYYSHDDVDGDFELKHFSIDHDRQTLLPFIKSAMRYQPRLRMWASPWCPPAWMKNSKHYAEMAAGKFNDLIAQMLPRMDQTDPLRFRMVTTHNDTPADSMGYEGRTSFNMSEPYLKAYARYFGKFVEAYKKEGVDIFMVMPQNEPNSAQPFPSCCWTSKDLNTFVGKYLGPEMDKQHVKVFVGTIERADPLKVDTLLSDSVTAKQVSGAGFQWAGKAALPVIHKSYPSLTLYGTEQECGNGLNNWEGAMHSWNLMKEYFAGGVNAYFYWNTSHFDNRPSRWGWYQNSLVTVDAEKHTYRFTPEYYVMKHASHYVQPGAKLLDVSGGYGDVLAFVNSDGSIVAILGNQTAKTVRITLLVGGIRQTVSLAPNTLNTFLIKS